MEHTSRSIKSSVFVTMLFSLLMPACDDGAAAVNDDESKKLNSAVVEPAEALERSPSVEKAQPNTNSDFALLHRIDGQCGKDVLIIEPTGATPVTLTQDAANVGVDISGPSFSWSCGEEKFDVELLCADSANHAVLSRSPDGSSFAIDCYRRD